MIKINWTVKEGTISVSKAGGRQKPWGGFYLQERWGGWRWSRAFMAEGTQACVGDVHSTFGKPEVGLLGWCAGQMAGDETGAAWCSLTFLGLSLIQKCQNTLHLLPTLTGAPWLPKGPLGSPRECVCRYPCAAHICSHSVFLHHLHSSFHCNRIHAASGHFSTRPCLASVYSCVGVLNGSNTTFTNS